MTIEQRSCWALGTALGAALGCFMTMAALPGCEAQPCTTTSVNRDDPSPAIECPSGQLCYRGACIRACSAGQEFEECASDSDCTDPARPRCTSSSVCSACEFTERCVPTLNICRPYVTIEKPDLRDPPVSPMRPPSPRDAGVIDGALQRPDNTEPEELPADAEITHIGFFDLAFEQDYRFGSPPVPETSARLVALTTRGNGLGLKWRPDLAPPRIQCADDDEDRDGCGDRALVYSGQCEIRPLRTVTSSTGVVPVGADLGSIVVDSAEEYPMSIASPLNAEFTEMSRAYVFANQAMGPGKFVLPTNFLLPPQEDDGPKFITVTGTGNTEVTVGDWPQARGDLIGSSIPREFVPRLNTALQLSESTVIASPPLADLEYRWERQLTGADRFDDVRVRILGGSHELNCYAEEDGQGATDKLTLKAELLRQWRDLEGPGTYTVYFERANARRLDISAQPDVVVDFSVRIRHSLISEVRFE